VKFGAGVVSAALVAKGHRDRHAAGSFGLPVVALCLVVASCGDANTTTNPTPAPAPNAGASSSPPTSSSPTSAGRLTPGTSWQWQLSGRIDTSFEVDMYDIDLFDAPLETIGSLKSQGRVVICYFSAGSWEAFRPDSGAFPEDVLGNALAGFPDERWLDIREIDGLAPIMEARLDLAVSKGCDGVEPDNVDGYTNDTGFPLGARDQLDYNRWLAVRAHDRGLSVGLKNDLDQILELEPAFDWALNEQCFEFDECELLLPFVDAGKAVFGVEYSGDPNEFCPEANRMNYDWLLKRVELDAFRVGCR
jgi:hypothetical protein